MILARSYLFVPGNRCERIPKALASGADAVIVDLEDAIPPAEKDAARLMVAAALRAEAPVWLRINGEHTPWCEADRTLLGHPGIAGVVVPKAESASHIAGLHEQGQVPLLPTIESGLGLARVNVLAAAAGTQRLMLGSIDLRADLGIPGGEEVIDPYRMQIVLASRLAGLPAPVEGITPSFNDPAVVEADTRRCAAMGFGAKLCIHPAQIAPVHRGFAPSPAEIEWARKVIAADDGAAGRAVALDGTMVDRPVVERARAILSHAG